jgi:ABC-2 type transport system ATP-binding protein
MNENNTILETKQLTRRFGRFIAVDNLNFSVKKQTIFGIIGPNGAGKSTLLKMLTTLLPPTKGDAYIEDISIVDHPNKIRQLIGYVPQLISVDGNLTGYENLLLFSKLYGIPKKMREETVNEALETVGLTNSKDKFVREYSGGMIRRLEIILALLHKPKVLFLDEPTSGLDPVAKEVLWDHLIKIHQENNITIVLTTHDMQEAEFICDNISIMLHGAMVKSGTPKELTKKLGEHATLRDVFIEYTGKSLESENAYYNVKQQRKTDERRG